MLRLPVLACGLVTLLAACKGSDSTAEDAAPVPSAEEGGGRGSMATQSAAATRREGETKAERGGVDSAAPEAVPEVDLASVTLQGPFWAQTNTDRRFEIVLGPEAQGVASALAQRYPPTSGDRAKVPLQDPRLPAVLTADARVTVLSPQGRYGTRLHEIEIVQGDAATARVVFGPAPTPNVEGIAYWGEPPHAKAALQKAVPLDLTKSPKELARAQSALAQLLGVQPTEVADATFTIVRAKLPNGHTHLVTWSLPSSTEQPAGGFLLHPKGNAVALPDARFQALAPRWLGDLDGDGLDELVLDAEVEGGKSVVLADWTGAELELVTLRGDQN